MDISYALAALLLREQDKELNEENITKILEAADVNVNSSRVKAMVAALEDVAVQDVVTEQAQEYVDEEPDIEGSQAEGEIQGQKPELAEEEKELEEDESDDEEQEAEDSDEEEDEGGADPTSI